MRHLLSEKSAATSIQRSSRSSNAPITASSPYLAHRVSSRLRPCGPQFHQNLVGGFRFLDHCTISHSMP